MSLLPYFLEAERPFVSRPGRIFDQHFGLGLTPDDMLMSMGAPQRAHHYYRPWRQLDAVSREVGSTIKSDKDKFQLNLDVQHFAPDEIVVKTADGCIVVEGKHDEKQDEHGHVSRHFLRRYVLPEGCHAETVESRLSSDGVLTVTAPRQTPPELKGERLVPIAHTGPVKKQSEAIANGDVAQIIKVNKTSLFL